MTERDRDDGGQVPRGRVDHDRLAATTREEIRCQMREDGDDPDAPLAGHRVIRQPGRGVDATVAGHARRRSRRR